jgi:dolichol-phosphate mannosyltransferase
MVKLNNTLVMIPTYNEKGNVATLASKIIDLNLPADILFIDDNSPDGTGQSLDNIKGMQKNNTVIHVIHRSGKLGVGSAHKVGIGYAYAEKYTTLVTMDADGTHDPTDIPKFIRWASDEKGYDLVVGTRHMREDSLEGWSLWRKLVTRTGHILTTCILGIPFDATGAFRLYRLDKIPIGIFLKVKSDSYSFFFESLTILNLNKVKIIEIPITLSARSIGHSKLEIKDLIKSLWFMIMFRLRMERDKESLIV